jgi:class 3 adenylate cyclase
MFVDLVGSTELSQQLDPKEMQTVLKSYQSAVTAAIEHYEGRVAKLMGDGVLLRMSIISPPSQTA